jgi:predicted DsbA family dithiol-disulfide isomerase
MHDALFANQENLVEGHISELGESLGLDAKTFTNCMTSDKFTNEIQASISQGNNLGLGTTPSFLIGTVEKDGNTVHIEKRFGGMLPYETFKADLRLIETEID